MLLLVLLLQLPGPPILTIFSNHRSGSEYRNVLNTKLFPPHISSSSLLLHITCVISSQSSLLNPLNHPHWSLLSNHQSTAVSGSQTALSGMPHLTCGTIFLLLFVFLISSIHHHHPALLHHHTLILDRLMSFLTAFSTLVLKPSFSQSLSSIAIHPLVRPIPWNFTGWCLAVSDSVGECRRWMAFGHSIITILTYLYRRGHSRRPKHFLLRHHKLSYWTVSDITYSHTGGVGLNKLSYSRVLKQYGIVWFNVPLDTLQVISEMIIPVN